MTVSFPLMAVGVPLWVSGQRRVNWNQRLGLVSVRPDLHLEHNGRASTGLALTWSF
jgi:hypothetical protein